MNLTSRPNRDVITRNCFILVLIAQFLVGGYILANYHNETRLIEGYNTCSGLHIDTYSLTDNIGYLISAHLDIFSGAIVCIHNIPNNPFNSS